MMRSVCQCSRLGAVSLLVTGWATSLSAQLLPVVDCRATPTDEFNEITPTLGVSGSSTVLVYTRRPVVAQNTQGNGEIFYRRVLADACSGDEVRVSEVASGLDDQLNDVSGRYIVYTSLVSNMPRQLKLYNIETGLDETIIGATNPGQARIHGDKVVWMDYDESEQIRVMLCDIATDRQCLNKHDIAGPYGYSLTSEVSERFVVWAPYDDVSSNVYAYELSVPLGVEPHRVIAASDAANEMEPTTSGPWIAWVVREAGVSGTRIEALNVDTSERRVVVSNGAENRAPSAHGDVLAFDSNVSGNYDIWVYRFSVGDLYQITDEVADQRISNVFGNYVAYTDKRNGATDIYLANMTCMWPELGGDDDADDVCAAVDNCVSASNPAQQDSDGDGLGDVCDACPLDPLNDVDGDAVCGDVDSCPLAANSTQSDADADGYGDVCDPCPADASNDSDNDAVCGEIDNCPTTANSSQGDSDVDGVGDACDACPLDPLNDVDGDTICGNVDNCTQVVNAGQLDGDGDGFGDACDACPLDTDNDVDGDGVCAGLDNCPSLYNLDQADSDVDSIGDACDEFPQDADNDIDQDGISGDADNCPSLANTDQVDSDADGAGDACDVCPLDPTDDADGDGACNAPAVTCGDGEAPDVCGACITVTLRTGRPHHHAHGPWWWRGWHSLRSWSHWPWQEEGDSQCLCRPTALVVPATLTSESSHVKVSADLVFSTRSGNVECHYARGESGKSHHHRGHDSVLLFVGCSDTSVLPGSSIEANEVTLDASFAPSWPAHRYVEATVHEAGSACSLP